MKSIIILVFILLTCSLIYQVNAQSVNDYFYPGATLFVKDNIPEAKLIVEKGLDEFPLEPKLVELYKRILEKQQENNEQQDQQNDKNQDQNQDQQQQNQDQQQQDQQQEQQKDQQQQPQNQQQQEQKISKEEAERILDALKENEKDLQKQLRKVRGQRVKTEKDW